MWKQHKKERDQWTSNQEDNRSRLTLSINLVGKHRIKKVFHKRKVRERRVSIEHPVTSIQFDCELNRTSTALKFLQSSYYSGKFTRIFPMKVFLLKSHGGSYTAVTVPRRLVRTNNITDSTSYNTMNLELLKLVLLYCGCSWRADRYVNELH